MAATSGGWQGITQNLAVVGRFLLAISPGLIVLSFVVSALMWVMAGSSTKMAKRAQDQFKATLVVLVIIGSYYIIRGIASGLTTGQFG